MVFSCIYEIQIIVESQPSLCCNEIDILAKLLWRPWGGGCFFNVIIYDPGPYPAGWVNKIGPLYYIVM